MSSVSLVRYNRVSEKSPPGPGSSRPESRDIILLSKHSTLSSQPEEEASVMDTARKKTKPKEVIAIRAPPPPAVARRNARERNRVKQVNNGFANLRQHIPNSIAAAFESGRNGNKKLSKVETLRMAVEYIRSLEELLSLSDNGAPNSTAPSMNHHHQSSTNHHRQSSTPLEVHSGQSYASSLASPSTDDDSISCNSTPPPPPPLQYIKVGGADSYHILPLQILENNEHLKSLKIENDLVPTSAIVKFKSEQLSSDGAPLSPGIYSESSLSPGTESDIQAFIPVFGIDELSSSPPTIKVEEDIPESSTEEMRILCSNLIMLQADTEGGDLGKQLNMNELISW